MNFLHIKMINQNLFEKSAVFSTSTINAVEKSRLFKEILLFMRFITILYFACQITESRAVFSNSISVHRFLQNGSNMVYAMNCHSLMQISVTGTISARMSQSWHMGY